MPEPLRVIQLITELGPAGAERIVFELATRLDRREFAVEVISLRSPGGEGAFDGAVADELRAAGVAVTPIRMLGKLDLSGALRLRRRLREAAPDLLHGHLFHANLAARWLGAGCGARVLSTIHVVERRPLPLRRWTERLTARRDDATVCVSDAVAAHARRDLGVRDPRVIENGIDLEPYLRCRRDAAPRSTRLAEWGLAEGPVVGCIARLDVQKGIDLLLRAAAQLPEVQIVIAGQGEQERALKALVAALELGERVRFLGHRPALQVLPFVDVFCMPSRWEGFGLAAVEALAAGVPVVVAAVDSLPDVVGTAAELVPPNDPDALAAALARVLVDPERARRAAIEGPALASRFAVERMVQGYEELYRELTARS